MWLKDFQDNMKESNKRDAVLYSRHLRNLLPRPTTTSLNKSTPCCVISSNYCSCINNNIVFSMNHHRTSANDDQSSKDESHNMEHIVSSRWNPTPEQLMALEEMYRRGVRTPSAEEIKLIAAKLRQFGKIEGKNVFYWFQNHKARERQKRRRQSESTSKKFVNDHHHIETLEGNDTGFSSKDLEAKQKNSLKNSPKEPASMQRSKGTESETDGWIHLDERELQQMNQRKIAKGATKLMDLSCRTPNSDILKTINITPSSIPETSVEAQQKMLSTLNFSIFSSSSNADIIKHKDATRDHQTLQLFPLGNDSQCSISATNHTDFKELMATMSSSFPPNQFYEFL